ncbi:helicase-related protein [Mucisphaera sp.]|uniref:preprotein translocase subunit SecA n=1 Tax=Mucisphaera sp. TaxID=2913024 RepID=UPI003D11A5B2
MISPHASQPDTGEELLLPSQLWRNLSRPAKPPKLPRGLDAVWNFASARLIQYVPRTRTYLKRAEQIHTIADKLKTTGVKAMAARVEELTECFRRGRDQTHDIEAALAVVIELADRHLGLRPYPVQVASALAMIDGCLAEVATGEGKTLIATMPAVLAGWRGRGCHVITVNDYLAGRDAETMGPLYHAAGLTVASLEQSMQDADRRAAYLADITYLTNKEVAADYLRDRLKLGKNRGLAPTLLEGITTGRGSSARGMVQRGLAHAIIDEADSVLVDEAVTPLIISAEAHNEEQAAAFAQAVELAERLQRDEHYRVIARYKEIELTRKGRIRAEELTADLNLSGVWSTARGRDELVHQAITAKELFLKGQQYVIQEGKIVIVDEATGRLMPDRSWRHGLHQAVEAKEGLEVTPAKETLARISFQRFFRLYEHLSGMTGTAWEERHEFWEVYQLPVVPFPTHKPKIREEHPDRVFATREARWLAVAEEARRLHATGRPVLIGTRSVEASEKLSALLNAQGLEHEVLNAVRHEEEAAVIARAGEPRRITVATNMAGRGTDIKLARTVAESGGLAVIATERHESGRVDRQLFGRAGRQGDPGSAVCYVSLEDELIKRHTRKVDRTVLAGYAENPVAARYLFNQAQSRAQRMARANRKAVLQHDHWLERHLGFARE